jgi:hypothetical protein
MKTEHEFNSQVDVLTKDSVKSPERLAKLGDLKAKWRAARSNPEALQVLCDDLDAVAVEVRNERKAAAPKPAAPAPLKPASATPATPAASPGTAHGPTGASGPHAT